MNRDDICVLVLLAISLAFFVFVLPAIFRDAAKRIDDSITAALDDRDRHTDRKDVTR